MSTPILTDSPLGQRTETIWTPPYSRDDFIRMDAMLEDSTVNGCYALRWLDADSIKIIITENR